MNTTKIEWCDKTLNPVVGCSFGCEYCYARRLNTRFKYIPDFSRPQFFPERLEDLSKDKPSSIFITSMSDPADWRQEWADVVFKAISNYPQHRYLFLSKRPERYSELFPIWRTQNPALHSVWWGTSITEQRDLERVGYLPLEFHRFISIEPILGPIDLQSRPYRSAVPFVDWVIIGAETGNRRGKVTPRREWVEEIVKCCDSLEIPVFMKDSLLPIVGERDIRRNFPPELQPRRRGL